MLMEILIQTMLGMQRICQKVKSGKINQRKVLLISQKWVLDSVWRRKKLDAKWAFKRSDGFNCPNPTLQNESNK